MNRRSEKKESFMRKNKQTPVFPTVLAVLLTLLLFLTACGSDPEVEFNGDGDADSEPQLSYLTLGGGSTDGNPAIVVIGFDVGDEASWAESRIELDHVRLFESLQDAPRIYGSTDGRLSVPLAASVPVALRFQPPTETAFKRLDLAGGYATDAAAISLVVKKSGLSREVLLPDGLPFTLTDSVTPWRAGERYHYVVRLPLADWLEGTGTEDGGDVILYHDPNRNGRLDAGEDAESHIAGRVRISDPSSCDPNCEARSACDQVALGLCPNDDPAEMSWPTCIEGHLYDCLTPPGSECCDGVGRVPLPVGVCATEHVCDSAADGDDGGDGDVEDICSECAGFAGTYCTEDGAACQGIVARKIEIVPESGQDCRFTLTITADGMNPVTDSVDGCDLDFMQPLLLPTCSAEWDADAEKITYDCPAPTNCALSFAKSACENTDGDTDGDEEPTICSETPALHCGDRLTGTTVYGTDEWRGYACTARLESGKEAIYSIRTAETCQVDLRLTDLDTDLDLMLLDGCDAFDSQYCSSTPLDIQTVEEISFSSQPDKEYFVVVDGYNGSEGSYGLEVDCNCDPDPTFSCLTISPDPLDFGERQLDCEGLKDLHLANSCNHSVTIADLSFSGSDVFSFLLPITLPFVLEPAESIVLSILAETDTQGAQAENLNIAIQSGEINGARSAALQVTGGQASYQMDSFHQISTYPADILFVVDCSGSMGSGDFKTRLTMGFERLLELASANEADLHVALTTTDVQGHGGLFQGDPAVLAFGGAGGLTAEQMSQKFNERIDALGSACDSSEESGLEAAYRALSEPNISGTNAGFMRSDARLILVFVSDENDHSTQTAAFYADYLRSLKGFGRPELLRAYALTGDDPGGCSGDDSNMAEEGTRYIAVADFLTPEDGEHFLSICDTDYSPLFDDIANSTFVPLDRFPLSREPVADTIRVFLDDGEAEGWSYLSVGNSILFDAAHIPADGGLVVVDYTVPCP